MIRLYNYRMKDRVQLIVQGMFLVQYYILITCIYMHNGDGSESECDTFEPPTVKTVKSPVK